MKQQITRISPHQSSKIIALVYVVLALPLAVLGIIGLFFGQPQYEFRSLFLIVEPVLCGAIGYVFLMLFCWLYNIIAKRIGGLEFTITDVPEV